MLTYTRPFQCLSHSHTIDVHLVSRQEPDARIGKKCSDRDVRGIGEWFSSVVI